MGAVSLAAATWIGNPHNRVSAPAVMTFMMGTLPRVRPERGAARCRREYERRDASDERVVRAGGSRAINARERSRPAASRAVAAAVAWPVRAPGAAWRTAPSRRDW